MARTNLARRISSGVYGRLEFDFACNRGHGFGESYLQGVLLSIVTSNVDPQIATVLPGHALPAIQSASSGPGRRREVDLAVADRDDPDDISVCIEAKWAGSSHAKSENILKDLCRLALAHEANPSSTCLFVLAGGKSEIAKLEKTKLFRPYGKKDSKRLLQFEYHRSAQNAYYITDSPRRRSVLTPTRRAKLSKSLPKLPARVVTTAYKPAHDSPPDWDVRVWRVIS